MFGLLPAAWARGEGGGRSPGEGAAVDRAVGDPQNGGVLCVLCVCHKIKSQALHDCSTEIGLNFFRLNRMQVSGFSVVARCGLHQNPVDKRSIWFTCIKLTQIVSLEVDADTEHSGRAALRVYLKQ